VHHRLINGVALGENCPGWLTHSSSGGDGVDTCRRAWRTGGGRQAVEAKGTMLVRREVGVLRLGVDSLAGRNRSEEGRDGSR
jgi:hypothetical protein